MFKEFENCTSEELKKYCPVTKGYCKDRHFLGYAYDCSNRTQIKLYDNTIKAKSLTTSYIVNVFAYIPQTSLVTGYLVEFIRNNRRLGPNITQRTDSIYNTSVKFYEESVSIMYGNATYNRTEHYTHTWILTQWIGNRSFLELSPSVSRKCLSFEDDNFLKTRLPTT